MKLTALLTFTALQLALLFVLHAADPTKAKPDIVARPSRFALDWKATLPKAPNPECVSKQSISEKSNAPKPGAKGSAVTPEVRAKAFTRWEANKDGVLTLDEYQAGLKGQENVEARFKSFDKNGDAKLTCEEFVGPITQ